MASLEVPPLSGSLVRVEPLSAAHVPDLTEAAEENRASYGLTWVPAAADVADYVREQQERVGLTPFAQIRLADGQAVGCTAYWDVRTWAGRQSPRPAPSSRVCSATGRPRGPRGRKASYGTRPCSR